MSTRLTGGVLRAMGIFGGVKVASILCSIVRTKLIAVWIGPVGVGLFAIFNGALDMITAISQVGLRNSAVRDISQHRGTQRIALVMAVTRRWAWVLGLAGAAVTVAISPLLSRWTFGNDSWTWGFMALGVAVLLNSLGASEGAIMQGLEKLKQLARASVWGVVIGFAVSVPMFYFWRIDSVLPSILAYSLTTAVAMLWYGHKQPAKVHPTWEQSVSVGRSFLVLGAFMVASDVITQVLTYVFTAWLNLHSSAQEVGYYRGGFTVVNRYVGLVFSAIAMEYYPRLAAATGHRNRMALFVFHEMKTVLWVLLPLVMTFICAAPLIVRILYTPDFLVIVPFISIAMVGTVLRGISWCMAYVMLARGDGKIYLFTEAMSDAIMLGLNLAGYLLWGLTGLGIAYVCWYVIYTVMVTVVYRRYGYGMKPGVLVLAGCVLSLCVAQLFVPLWLGIILAAGSVIASLKALRN